MTAAACSSGRRGLGSTTIFQKAGVSPEVVFADSVLVASVATYPNDVSQDGQFLLYQQSTSRGYDLGVIPLSGDRKPIAVCQRPIQRGARSLLAKPPVDRVRVG